MTNKKYTEVREEYRKKFENHGEFLYNRGGYPATWSEIYEFIENALERQEKEIKKKVLEALPEEVEYVYIQEFDTYSPEQVEVYNQAIAQMRKKLKKLFE
jgi:hypothetical protein